MDLVIALVTFRLASLFVRQDIAMSGLSNGSIHKILLEKGPRSIQGVFKRDLTNSVRFVDPRCASRAPPTNRSRPGLDVWFKMALQWGSNGAPMGGNGGNDLGDFWDLYISLLYLFGFMGF